MYQLTNYGGSGLQVVSPDPPDAGGAAINANFKVLATTVAASDPGSDDDSTAGFGVGSRWYNPDSTVEWICLDATPGAAEWAAITSGSLAGYLPLTGGTMAGALDMGGNPLMLVSAADISSDLAGNVTISGNSLTISNTAMGGGNLTGVGTLGFNDSTAQTTAGLPLVGGTMSGDIAGVGTLTAATVNANATFGCPGIYATTGAALQLAGGDAGETTQVLGTLSILPDTTHALSLNSAPLNMNLGGGSGGGTLNMDSGTIQGPLSFFGATAVGQQSAAGNTSTPNPGSSTPVLVDTTFDGGIGSTAYTIGDIVAALKKYGLLVN